jgi:hypothetical protein
MISIKIKEKIDDIYAIFNEKSLKRIAHIPKKRVDELYKLTINKLQDEDKKLASLSGNYDKQILTSPDQRSNMHISITNGIYENFKRQMYKYTDKNYINLLFSANDDIVAEEQAAQDAKLADDQLAKQAHYIDKPGVIQFTTGGDADLEQLLRSIRL